MLKPVAAMTDHEMLVELMQEKRRNERARNIKYMIAGAVLVLVIILLIKYVPPVVRYFQKLNGTIETMQNSIAAVQGVADSINGTVTNLWNKIGGLFH